MNTDLAWPDNILPALQRQAAKAERSAILSLHPRLITGLRELAATDERAQRLLTLCEQWTASDAPVSYAPANDVLEILGEPES